ncbi:hypothetical protein V5O48_009584, partial [Marasmius crinis-equi]
EEPDSNPKTNSSDRTPGANNSVIGPDLTGGGVEGRKHITRPSQLSLSAISSIFASLPHQLLPDAPDIFLSSANPSNIIEVGQEEADPGLIHTNLTPTDMAHDFFPPSSSDNLPPSSISIFTDDGGSTFPSEHLSPFSMQQTEHVYEDANGNDADLGVKIDSGPSFDSLAESLATTKGSYPDVQFTEDHVEFETEHCTDQTGTTPKKVSYSKAQTYPVLVSRDRPHYFPDVESNRRAINHPYPLPQP